MDRLSRRPWPTAALPTEQPGAPAGGAPAQIPTGNTPPIPAPTPPGAPAAPAPAPPPAAPVVDDVERESSADQAPVRRLTQTRLTTLLAREAQDGGRKVVRDRFGVGTLEELDAIVAAGKAAQRAALPADQQAQAELAEERRLRQVAEAQRDQVTDDRRLSDALFAAQCSLPAAAIAELRADGVQVGADAYAISGAIDRLKARAPALFAAPAAVPPPVPGAAAPPPAPGTPAPAAPAAPAVAAGPGAPPAPAPTPPSTGFGTRGRAEAERRGHLKPPPAPAAAT